MTAVGGQRRTNRRPLLVYVWKLLRLQTAMTLSAFRAARLRRKIGMILISLIVAAFAVFIFVLSWLLLGLLRSPELAQFLSENNLGTVSGFLGAIPVLILAGSFLAILLTSFGVLLQGLYLAGDMEFLLCAPVPARAVFVTKLLQAILPNFGFIALFSLPVLFGLGASGGYNLLYYPLVVLILGMLALAAAGASSLLVMGVVRIFPARRVAEVLGFIGATISILCSQSGNFMRFSNPDWENMSGQEVPLVNLITRFNSPYSPLAWAGRSLVDIGEGRWLSGVFFLAATLALAGGLFLVALRTAERLYYSGWASVQVGGRRKKPARMERAASRGAPPSPVAGILPRSVGAILRKDFTLMRRDLRNMSQLVTPIIVGLVYAVYILRSGFTSDLQRETPAEFLPIVRNAAIYLNVGISMFISWSMLSRLALMSFSQEGRNYWIIKLSPVRTGRLILAKYLSAYLPALVIGWLFLLVITLIQGGGFAVLAFGLTAVTLTLAGTAGINLAFGIIGANLVWEDPRKMNSGWSGCLSFLLGFAYVGVSLLLFFAPPLILSGFGLPEALGQAAGIVLGGGISLACAILPPVLASGRVARIGEG